MASFYGKFQYTVDAKGRFNIPAKWRKLLSPEARETFVISRAPGGCLRAFPFDEWEKHVDKLRRMGSDAMSEFTRRAILETAADQALDKQGRVTLSAEQMQLAGITKDVTLTGGTDCIEIWDPERFNAYMKTREDFDATYYEAMSRMST
jgi:MraZ protein